MGFREKEALLRKEGYYILQSLHLHQIPLSIVIHPLLDRGMEKLKLPILPLLLYQIASRDLTC
jgi:hypothetical protein